MTEINNVIRWNTNFVRGLAQSVLERAKVIRSSMSAPTKTKAKKSLKKKSTTKKTKTSRRKKRMDA